MSTDKSNPGVAMPQDGDPIADDFRNFLYLLWEHLGLPEPTQRQYEIAFFMQWGFPETYDPITGRAEIVEAFRGVGKSYIAAGFALWRLYRDPVNEKILIISASSVKAKEFVSQVKGILMTWDLLAHLRPRPDQRDAFDRFDVNGASLSQSPSLKAAGITGQITGSRATLIIADDVEIKDNSRTEESRANLMNSVKEFENIKVPALVIDGELVRPAGDILFLGTPQSAESIYVKLIKEFNHLCFCVPARYPTPDKRENYVVKRENGNLVDILAEPLKVELEADPRLAGKPTDPRRFNEDDLLNREGKTGRTNFLLQFMLDTTLSDAERYPLKQNDLIVFSCNMLKAPITLQWGRHSDRLNVRDDLPNVGFTGDQFLGPLFVDKEWREYQGSVLFVDPSGRGKDETAWAILKVLNGMMFVLRVGGFQGDVNEAYLRIATDAKTYGVNLILIEPNFAPGVWIAGFQPVLQKVWPPVKRGETGGCTVMEADWARGRKEERIIDTLEPVMNTHRLVVDEAVARDDILMYQLTHITRDRNALSHDDRLDALAGAVSHFTRVMEIDTDQAKKEMQDEELDAVLAEFVETCLGYPGQFRRLARRRDRTLGPRDEIEVYQS